MTSHAKVGPACDLALGGFQQRAQSRSGASRRHELPVRRKGHRAFGHVAAAGTARNGCAPAYGGTTREYARTRACRWQVQHAAAQGSGHDATTRLYPLLTWSTRTCWEPNEWDSTQPVSRMCGRPWLAAIGWCFHSTSRWFVLAPHGQPEVHVLGAGQHRAGSLPSCMSAADHASCRAAHPRARLRNPCASHSRVRPSAAARPRLPT